MLICRCLVALALAFSVSCLVRPRPEPADPGEPRTVAPPVVHLIAALAPIGPLEREFAISPANPFVPLVARRDEERALAAPDAGGGAPVPAPGAIDAGTTADAPITPALSPGRPGAAAPQPLGIVAHAPSARRVLLVQATDGSGRALAPGATLDGWTLLAVDTAVRWRAPDGAEVTTPVPR